MHSLLCALPALTLLFLCLPSSVALPSCSPSDLVSLQSFQSLISTALPWTNHTDCCSWHGVGCNAHGRVVSLHLPSSNLSGSISPHLFELSALESLDLDYNVHVGGTIPSEIGMSSKLEIIRLRGNGITGHIPKEIGNCKQMKEIWLDDNELTGTIPVELGKLSLLTHLSLSNNKLYGPVCDAIVGCAKLSYLCLSGNKGTGELRRMGRPGRPDDAYMSIWVESRILLGGLSVAVTRISTVHILPYRDLLLLSCCDSASCIRSTRKCSDNIPNRSAFKKLWQPFIWRSTLNIESLFRLRPSQAIQAYLTPTEAMQREKSQHRQFHRHLLQNTSNDDGQSGGMQRPLIIGVVCGIAVFCAILLIAVVAVLCRKKAITWRKMHATPPRHPPRLPASLRRIHSESSQVFDPTLASISMRDLVKATDDFHRRRVIGDGGFGLVYRATLCDGRKVAVKKLATDGIQGTREFEAELQTLGRIKHLNLVELLAFCKAGEDRALVYEFIENGSLDTWLHERADGPRVLDWKKRTRIAVGAAKGLAYLHHDCNPHVLHRDIKSSNILLGKDFEPRIADFGLARHMSSSFSHVSTEGAGTLGYMAPEYNLTLHATRSADVYSFGVLMLELASGKRPSSVLEDKNIRSLTQWVHHVVKYGCEMKIIDSVFEEKPPPYEQVRAYISVADACVSEDPKKRPTMMQVHKQISDQLEADRAHDQNAEKSLEMQKGDMDDS